MDTSASTILHAGPAWPQLTERLRIRPATPADAQATWAYRRLPESSRWVNSAWKDYESYARSFREPSHLSERLVVEYDGGVVGEVVVRLNDAWTQREVSPAGAGTEAELGWSLDPSFSGRGLATEAVARVLRLCFTDLGLRRVHARCFADNQPSWRLMERLGMRRESHVVAAALHRDGKWLDGFGYALLAEEWREGQQL